MRHRQLPQPGDARPGRDRQREDDLRRPESKKVTGGAFSVYEHDAWIFTLTRVAESEPPDDLPGMILMATQFAPPTLLRALKRGEPISEISVFRYPGANFRDAVLSAAETSPTLSEKLYRSMNLVDPPTDYSTLLTS
jgi:hypothetical protein